MTINDRNRHRHAVAVADAIFRALGRQLPRGKRALAYGECYAAVVRLLNAADGHMDRVRPPSGPSQN